MEPYPTTVGGFILCSCAMKKVVAVRERARGTYDTKSHTGKSYFKALGTSFCVSGDGSDYVSMRIVNPIYTYCADEIICLATGQDNESTLKYLAGSGSGCGGGYDGTATVKIKGQSFKVTGHVGEDIRWFNYSQRRNGYITIEEVV